MAERVFAPGQFTKTISAVYENGVLRPLERLDLEEHQTVSLHILPPRVRIPAVVARRKVNVFVGNEISYLMGGRDPELVVGDPIVWRVPVVLTFPSHGAVGTVGVIEVNAETGELFVSPALIEEITHNAQALVDRLPPEAEPTRYYAVITPV
jgi:predicted DNA-binding antitoxin AbrB/MazE fold protein